MISNGQSFFFSRPIRYEIQTTFRPKQKDQTKKGDDQLGHPLPRFKIITVFKT